MRYADALITKQSPMLPVVWNCGDKVRPQRLYPDLAFMRLKDQRLPGLDLDVLAATLLSARNKKPTTLFMHVRVYTATGLDPAYLSVAALLLPVPRII